MIYREWIKFLPLLVFIFVFNINIFNAEAAKAIPDIDNISSADNSISSSLAWSHTIGDQDNRIVFASILGEDNNTINIDITGVTFNSVAMTELDSQTVDSSFDLEHDIWYMLDASLPAAGTYTIEVTYAGITDSNGAIAMTIYDAEQQAAEAKASTQNAVSPASATTTVTLVTDVPLIIDALAEGGGTRDWQPDDIVEHIKRAGLSAGGSIDMVMGTLQATTTKDYSLSWLVAPGTNRLNHTVTAWEPARLATVSTTPATLVTDTTATFNGNVNMQSATITKGFFQYDTNTGDPYANTTTPSSVLTASGTYSTNVTGLTTFTKHFVRGAATSSTDGGALFTFGLEKTLFTGDEVTTTPRALLYDTPLGSNWDQGTFTDTEESGTDLRIAASGGGANRSTTTESFEGVSDQIDIDAGSIFFSPGTNDCNWEGESTDTGSNPTGANGALDGNIYAFTETSNVAGGCFTSGDIGIMQLDSSFYQDGAGAWEFSYNAFGTDIGTVTFEAFDDTDWHILTTFTGQQHSDGVTWTTVYKELAATTTDLRVQHNAGGGFLGDISVDLFKIGTGTPAFSTGLWVSEAWNLNAVDSVDGSYISVASTTPGDSTVFILTAVNSSATTPPGDGEYTTSTPATGEAIAGLSNGTDLTGKFMWIKFKFDAGSSDQNQPSVQSMTLAIDDGEAAADDFAVPDLQFIKGENKFIKGENKVIGN